MVPVRKGLAALAATVLAFTACGRRGEPEPPPIGPITVSFSEVPYRFITFTDELRLPHCATATFTPWPEGLAAIQATDSGTTFRSGTVTTIRVDGDVAKVCPALEPTELGAQSGQLTLTLCKDVDCRLTYDLTNPTLDYGGTLYAPVPGQPLLEATLLIDGAPPAAPSLTAGSNLDVRTYGLSLKSGQRLEIDVGEPMVRWQIGSMVARPPLVSDEPPTLATGSAFTLRVRADLAGDTYFFAGRTADGQKIEVDVMVRP